MCTLCFSIHHKNAKLCKIYKKKTSPSMEKQKVAFEVRNWFFIWIFSFGGVWAKSVAVTEDLKNLLNLFKKAQIVKNVPKLLKKVKILKSSRDWSDRIYNVHRYLRGQHLALWFDTRAQLFLLLPTDKHIIMGIVLYHLFFFQQWINADVHTMKTELYLINRRKKKLLYFSIVLISVNEIKLSDLVNETFIMKEL
jgi:hypothetical protein